jgi:hypothetical protein
MSIYVEILVRAPMDAIWRCTQTPALHERWDLRFSRIEYLPGSSESEAQRFRYSTRIGFGVEVAGDGETVGERDRPDGSRSSALRFGSDSRLSIIREGSGYWKYQPVRDGILFLTRYDYRTRFGTIGAAVDRWIVRPLIGWATAWSFDRLRLWLEDGVDPAQAVRQAIVRTLARAGLAVVFAYQGLVPKLLVRHADEIGMLRDVGIADAISRPALTALGLMELGLAAALLVSWQRRWPSWLCLLSMPVATGLVGMQSPRYLTAAFNPVSLNVAVACLAAVDLLMQRSVPSAARCRRSSRERV